MFLCSIVIDYFRRVDIMYSGYCDLLSGEYEIYRRRFIGQKTYSSTKLDLLSMYCRRAE